MASDALNQQYVRQHAVSTYDYTISISSVPKVQSKFISLPCRLSEITLAANIEREETSVTAI